MDALAALPVALCELNGTFQSTDGRTAKLLKCGLQKSKARTRGYRAELSCGKFHVELRGNIRRPSFLSHTAKKPIRKGEEGGPGQSDKLVTGT